MESGKRCSLPSGEYHDIGGQLSPILELDTRFREAFDLAVGLQFDLPLGNELAASGIFEEFTHEAQWKIDEQT